MNTPTDNTDLLEILWKVKQGEISVNDGVVAILTHIDTVCREARGCVDCKALRCENCERLWAS